MVERGETGLTGERGRTGLTGPAGHDGPSKSEVDWEQLRQISRETTRRMAYILVAFFLLAAGLAVTLHDQHIEHCWPPDVDARIFGISEKTLCDLSFPLHDHPYEKE